ncbi:CBS domain-containing protein [Desulfacinum hydrothermale DSM 13146]|uniref:CBS domain-containing protein n=1 Tax=Desulfacinum hydrothermale DSM 13146 TaxID=1121390 RepID=A0A1W1XJQ2_9BACT|nr:CBS domain-containing protein [Desulfacinum hydrothermale]SMC23728.1 CBS domain-containing protein [Desulfacinum hydrothermale DSM 13146]
MEAVALPGAYRLVGMGSVAAGTTHASITAILILFELTGDYKIILPMMPACIVSTVVARRFQRASIYPLKLIRRGVDLSAGKELNVLTSLRVADSMNRRVETVPEAATFRDLKQKLLDSPYQNHPVVNGSGEVTGILSFQDIRTHILDDTLEDLVRIRDVSRSPTATLTPTDNLHTAMTLMDRHNQEMLPVVSAPGSRRLIGVLSRSDILRDYNHAILHETARKSPDAPKAG